MMPGPADRSYGIHVAKLAGMPTELLKRAESILQKLENQKQSSPVTSSAPSQVAEESGQLSLFKESAPSSDNKFSKKQQKVLHELLTTDLLDVTPMEAMNILYQWQRKLRH